MKKTVKSLEELNTFVVSLANDVIEHCKKHKKNKATIFALQGDLGAGKTTFSKSFIGSFGVKETVTSPTFVIEKIYKIPNNKSPRRQASRFRNIIHIDAYRLTGGEDLEVLGWKEISNNPENIILIEWPEMVEDVLPEDVHRIKFKVVDENSREIEVESKF